MPGSRRRRSRAARRSWGRTILVVVAAAFVAVVVVGSVAEITAQSRQYRSATNTGYASMATRVVEDSNRTGTQLADLLAGAPTLPNTYFGSAAHPTGIRTSARAVIQQGLDQAVQGTGQEADQAAALVPPSPTGGVGQQLVTVMATRATATGDLRTAIDQMLGMSPLAVAGASTVSSSVPAATALLSPGQASARLAAAGRLLQQADDAYRSLRSLARSQPTAIHLPTSVWVRTPADSATLGPTQLAATATALSDSVPLHPFHQLIITAVGLAPPAINTGGTGIVPGAAGNSCFDPQSTGPLTSATILPPTTSVSAAITVTNCGTVDERGVQVTQVLTVSDPAGTAPPPPRAAGGRSEVTVDLPPGGSVAVDPRPASVVTGHLYTLTLTVAPAVSTGSPQPGSAQAFLIRVAP